jgi:hypothetical protein
VVPLQGMAQLRYSDLDLPFESVSHN